MQNNETPTTLSQETAAPTETNTQGSDTIEIKAGDEAHQASFSGETNINSDNQSLKLSPKFKSMEDQAQAYFEAEKALTRKSQELSDAKKALETFRDSDSKVNQQQEMKSQDDSNGQFSPQCILDIERLENTAKRDYKTISSLYRSGIVNQVRANSMRTHVDALLSQEKQKIFSKFRNGLNPVKSNDSIAVVNEFCVQNPGFFDSRERSQVLNYVKKTSDSICKNDLDAIADLIQSVEKSAIEHYKKELDKDTSLQNQNARAKSKLTSVSDATTNSSLDSKKVFTRAEIRRMSKQEFEQNESLIMKQMAKGLIK